MNKVDRNAVTEDGLAITDSETISAVILESMQAAMSYIEDSFFLRQEHKELSVEDYVGQLVNIRYKRLRENDPDLARWIDSRTTSAENIFGASAGFMIRDSLTSMYEIFSRCERARKEG